MSRKPKPKPKPWGGARAGAGRKTGPTGRTRIKLGIAVTEDQHRKLMAYCQAHAIGTSVAIQRLLDQLQ